MVYANFDKFMIYHNFYNTELKMLTGSVNFET